MASIAPIETTVSKTNAWLYEIAEQLGDEDPQRAYRALRAVLHGLRDRLGVELSAHFSAQLPLLVRGVFYEGWDPTHTPKRLTVREFLEYVEREATCKGTSEAEAATQAVATVLWRHLGDGLMTHVISVLPDEYADIL